MKAPHPILGGLPLAGIVRIDLGLEGDWSPTVRPVWSREEGFLGFGDPLPVGHDTTPALELYFDGAWVGVHCGASTPDGVVLDAFAARRVIDWVETRLV